MDSFNNAETIEDVRRLIRDRLTPKYGEREATEMARIILSHLKGWDFSRLLAYGQRSVSDFIKGRSAEIVGQLLNDVPLQYILGTTRFYGLDLKVRPGVLIPRPETEELVDMIAKENQTPDLRVLDLCTGSGAIAVALARNLPYSRLTAIDISPVAVETARENARELKVKVDVEEEDVFQAEFPEGSFDIIVSNPPYVDESEKKDMEPNVLDHEPHEALFVPDDNPLLFYQRIADLAATALAKNGRLYLEINPRHARELKTLLEGRGFVDVEIIKDIHGKDRFARATADK